MEKWKQVPLADICTLQNGRAFKKTEWVSEGMPIIRIQNLNNPTAGFNHFDGEYDDRIKVCAGDLLFSWSGTVGSSFGPHIWDRAPGLLNQHIFKVTLSDEIAQRYAYYALLYITAEIERSVHGAVGLVHISKTKLNQFQIPLPRRPEQEWIVQILDEAFAAIATATANAEKNLANARELFESMRHSSIARTTEGWDHQPLGEVCENLDRLRVPITKSKRVPGKVPYYGASGVVDHVAEHLFDEDLLLVSEDGANLLARTYPIAFSISGKSWVNNHAHVLRFTTNTQREFVERYLNSIPLDEWVSGMAQPKLNQRSLNSIPIPWSENDEPMRLLTGGLREVKSRSKKLTEVIEQKLAHLSHLKQSLLQKAFTGELTADSNAADRSLSKAGI